MGFGVPYFQTDPDMVYFVKTDIYTLWLFNIAMENRWPIEIDGKNLLIAW